MTHEHDIELTLEFLHHRLSCFGSEFNLQFLYTIHTTRIHSMKAKNLVAPWQDFILVGSRPNS